MHGFHLKAHYLLKNDITELYLTNAIRSFAVSTIAVFIPIFLIKSGFSFLSLCFFLLIRHGIGVLTCYCALVFANKKGAKHAILLSAPFTIAVFIMLYNINLIESFIGGIPFLLVLGVINALSGAFYYMGFHIEFAKFSNMKNAKQIGIVNILATVFSIIGPLFGALTITYFSFSALFTIVIILIFVSIIPLFLSSEVHEPFKFSLKHLIKNKTGIKNSIAFTSEGARWLVASTFWPILMYIIFTAISSIGVVYTFTNFILVIFTYYIGKKTVNRNKHKILKLGTFIHSLSLIFRTIVETVTLISVVQGFGALSWSMIHLPFSQIFYKNSQKQGIANLIFFREIFLHVGRLMIIIIFTILILFVKIKFALIITIIIGAAFTVFMTFITDEKEEK